MTPGSTYMRNHARCPFYRGDTRQAIICDGFLKNSTVSMRFGTQKEFYQHTNLFCCQRFQNCEVYRMVAEALGCDD